MLWNGFATPNQMVIPTKAINNKSLGYCDKLEVIWLNFYSEKKKKKLTN